MRALSRRPFTSSASCLSFPRFVFLTPTANFLMNLVGALFSSSIGRKMLMAVTGVILIGFVVGT